MNKHEFWNERALLGENAGTNDFIAKEIEMKTISSYIENSPECKTILDFGCGNGIMLVYLAKKFLNYTFVGIDFSENMIDQAQNLIYKENLQNRIKLIVGDEHSLDALEDKFDYIYTERSLINLDSFEDQSRCILKIISLLKEQGKYLMCECSLDGLKLINDYRKIFSLDKITPPWHNQYFSNANLEKFISDNKLKLLKVDHFSSTYYFISRVLNAKLALDNNEKPSYGAPINKLALTLPAINECGQGKLWVFEK